MHSSISQVIKNWRIHKCY